MTRDEWDARRFHLDAIMSLAAAYQTEHDWLSDVDPDATRELLAEVSQLHDELVEALGEPPAEPELAPVTTDEIPF